MSRKPHVIVITCPPSQGHIGPTMKLAYKLAAHGIKVTYVTTEFIHSKIIAAAVDKVAEQWPIKLVSISDGLDSDDDRINRVKMTESMLSFLPGELQELIWKINRECPEEKVTCVIADIVAGWALEVSKKMGIKAVGFALAGGRNLALLLLAPELIKAGIIHADGIPTTDEPIYLSNGIPPCKPNEFPWSCSHDPNVQRFIFTHFILNNAEIAKTCDGVLVNSFSELESPTAYDLIPNLLTIGPLHASYAIGPSAGSIFPEDLACLEWLDKQPSASVVYAAFGSTTAFSQQQFEELAHGLDLTGRPFLWVVGSKLTDGAIKSNNTKSTARVFPDGFEKRVANRANLVQWAPQEKVLAHPSIACFISHCGWNSTLEGLSNGVSFLCLPQYVDQFNNMTYICEVWKVGLELRPNELGILTRDHVIETTENLFSDDGIRANSLYLKEMARNSLGEGGSSFKNFLSFIEDIKQ